jgi:putative transposase
MSEREAYPTDLSEKEWEHLKALLPRKQTPLDKAREYLNAMLYIDRTGSSWRMMPHDLPNWSTVYTYFRKLSRDGTWQRINDALRSRVRLKAGREAEPSLLIGDSQSVKTTEKGGCAAGMAANT